jgi:transposase
MNQVIAGIDVHKRMLMVAVGVSSRMESEEGVAQAIDFESRRFGTSAAELLHLIAWLKDRGVGEAVMESTAQYWKPVWLALEPHFSLRLAQAWSNRAPRGKKTDSKDAQRLVRRHLAGELTLSFVPDAEQRQMRTVTRRRTQLARQRVRLQNQLECLLEEGRIKLSSVISDLVGASGRRILTAMAAGETNPVKLAALGDERLKCTREELMDALTGDLTAVQQKVLKQYLDQLAMIDEQMQDLSSLAAELMRPCQEAVMRLTQIPGVRVVAAQQILAEVGPTAASFPSAAQFSSWVGACPGRQESAGENYSSRCARGNRYLRGTLCQVAQAAVKTKNSYFQQKFRRLMPKLGFAKAIWAIVRHLCIVIWTMLRKGVPYEERGQHTTPQAAKRRTQRLLRELRILGYDVTVKPATPEAARA